MVPRRGINLSYGGKADDANGALLPVQIKPKQALKPITGK
jgi:hypothetical protein